jgi:hypothetical protein
MRSRAREAARDEPEPFPGVARSARRERTRSKAREGMQVSGASVKLLARAAAERARKAAVAGEKPKAGRRSRTSA